MISSITLIIFVVGSIVASVSSSDVADLDPNSFKKLVLQSDLPFLVEFFAPWCGHCQRLAPEWEKAATNLKGIVPLGKVDCTVHQGLCQQYQVQGYPTIKIFSEKGKKVTDYQTARQASAIVRSATDLLPNNVFNIKDKTTLDSFLSTTPQIPHVILFSSKKEVSPLMKSLSVVYKGRVSFAQVKQEVTEVVQKYNIESFPKILVIKGGDEETVTYDGAINPEELQNFINPFVGETVVEEKIPAPPPRTKPSKPTTEVSYTEVTASNLDTVCQGICIIGFVDVESSDKRTVKPEQQQILDGILDSFKSDGKFKFAWVDKNQENTITEKFSVNVDEPSLLVYNGKRQRYVKADSFDHKSCFRTIEHVLTGDAHYTNL